MKAVFADTFYWVALTNPNDARHQDACALDTALAGRILVTTDEVLGEFLTFFAGDAWLRVRAAETVRELLQDLGVHVIAQSRESFLAGLTLYAARPDKGYSLADCVSLQTMRREGIRDALTDDRHFEQEGFRALFRRP